MVSESSMFLVNREIHRAYSRLNKLLFQHSALCSLVGDHFCHLTVASVCARWPVGFFFFFTDGTELFYENVKGSISKMQQVTAIYLGYLFNN